MKNCFSVVGLLVLAVLMGCQKKEAPVAEMPVEEVEMVSNDEMTGEGLPMDATVAGDMASTTGAMESIEAVQAELSDAPFVKPGVREIQQALQNAGLYEGKIDGDLGPRTKKAIEDFQTQNGLTADGKVGPKTWAKLAPYLNSAPAVSAPAAVEAPNEVGY